MFKKNNKREISITYMSGPYDGKKIAFNQPDIGDERLITIGRRDSCDIHLPYDSQVSRIHAKLGCVCVPTTSTESVISPYYLTFWLEDGGSRNGTFIEKEPDPIEGRVSLRPGIMFRIGRTWLRLDIPISDYE